MGADDDQSEEPLRQSNKKKLKGTNKEPGDLPGSAAQNEVGADDDDDDDEDESGGILEILDGNI